jgi:hypothetical protein
MFASQVPSFRAAERLSPVSSVDSDHFDTTHPLYRDIAEMVRIRREEEALRRGRQITRLSSDKPGLLAISRISSSGDEVLAVFNTSAAVISARVSVEPTSARWTALHGACTARSAATGSYAVQVPALDFVVCKAAGGDSSGQ